MQLTQEHLEIQRTLRRFIDKEINPHVDEWEAAEIFPAHELFKKMGALGLLGLNKPVEFGGMGLDYSYALLMAETLGHIRCGAVPMAIGVQTDMATALSYQVVPPRSEARGRASSPSANILARTQRQRERFGWSSPSTQRSIPAWSSVRTASASGSASSVKRWRRIDSRCYPRIHHGRPGHQIVRHCDRPLRHRME